MRKTTNFLGLIRSRHDANRIIANLENHPRPDLSQVRDALRLLHRNWASIAARPEVADRIVKLAQEK